MVAKERQQLKRGREWINERNTNKSGSSDGDNDDKARVI